MYILHAQGSWKIGLRTSFKNFRRDNPEDTPRRALKDTTNQPRSEHPETVTDPDYEEVDEDQYAQDVSELKREWGKGSRVRSQAVLKTLMDKPGLCAESG